MELYLRRHACCHPVAAIGSNGKTGSETARRLSLAFDFGAVFFVHGGKLKVAKASSKPELEKTCFLALHSKGRHI
tara:strand:+ start:1710 stop:1934 length:225 start_codon:yes stop_codon:yes gene_type:complete